MHTASLLLLFLLLLCIFRVKMTEEQDKVTVGQPHLAKQVRKTIFPLLFPVQSFLLCRIIYEKADFHLT